MKHLFFVNIGSGNGALGPICNYINQKGAHELPFCANDALSTDFCYTSQLMAIQFMQHYNTKVWIWKNKDRESHLGQGHSHNYDISTNLMLWLCR